MYATETPEPPRRPGRFGPGFGPTVAAKVGTLGGPRREPRLPGPGVTCTSCCGAVGAELTGFSGSDLWAGSIYFGGGCHLVFAKIVERRPQNSRPGLPPLRSRTSGLEQARGTSASRRPRRRRASNGLRATGGRGPQCPWPRRSRRAPGQVCTRVILSLLPIVQTGRLRTRTCPGLSAPRVGAAQQQDGGAGRW